MYKAAFLAFSDSTFCNSSLANQILFSSATIVL